MSTTDEFLTNINESIIKEQSKSNKTQQNLSNHQSKQKDVVVSQEPIVIDDDVVIVDSTTAVEHPIQFQNQNTSSYSNHHRNLSSNSFSNNNKRGNEFDQIIPNSVDKGKLDVIEIENDNRFSIIKNSPHYSRNKQTEDLNLDEIINKNESKRRNFKERDYGNNNNNNTNNSSIMKTNFQQKEANANNKPFLSITFQSLTREQRYLIERYLSTLGLFQFEKDGFNPLFNKQTQQNMVNTDVPSKSARVSYYRDFMLDFDGDFDLKGETNQGNIREMLNVSNYQRWTQVVLPDVEASLKEL